MTYKITDKRGRGLSPEGLVSPSRLEEVSFLRQARGITGADRGEIDAIHDHRINGTHFAPAQGLDIAQTVQEDLAQTRDYVDYETLNNPDLDSIRKAFVATTVGAGGVAMINLGPEKVDLAEYLTRRFNQYASSDVLWSRGGVSLWDVCGEILSEQCVSGEAFLIPRALNSREVPHEYRTMSRMRLDVIHPRRIATPPGLTGNENIYYGIEYSTNGRPQRFYYRRGKAWDRSGTRFGNEQYSAIDYHKMFHLFIPCRIDQPRGLPWFFNGLNLAAQGRRLSNAVLTSFETAASVSAVIKTNGAFSTAIADAREKLSVPKPFEALPIRRNMMMTLPHSTEIEQFDSKHPNQNYLEYRRDLIRTHGRSLLMPYVVAGGDAKDMTFASGRMDHVLFQNVTTLPMQQWLRLKFLRRVFALWLREEATRPEFKWAITPKDMDFIVNRFFVAFRASSPQGDPLKERAAVAAGLNSGELNHFRVWAEQGLDPQLEMDRQSEHQIARGKQYMALKEAYPDLTLTEYGLLMTPTNGGITIQYKMDDEDEATAPAPAPAPAASKTKRSAVHG